MRPDLALQVEEEDSRCHGEGGDGGRSKGRSLVGQQSRIRPAQAFVGFVEVVEESGGSEPHVEYIY
jgi:hypothetical protein